MCLADAEADSHGADLPGHAHRVVLAHDAAPVDLVSDEVDAAVGAVVVQNLLDQ